MAGGISRDEPAAWRCGLGLCGWLMSGRKACSLDPFTVAWPCGVSTVTSMEVRGSCPGGARLLPWGSHVQRLLSSAAGWRLLCSLTFSHSLFLLFVVFAHSSVTISRAKSPKWTGHWISCIFAAAVWCEGYFARLFRNTTNPLLSWALWKISQKH